MSKSLIVMTLRKSLVPKTDTSDIHNNKKINDLCITGPPSSLSRRIMRLFAAPRIAAAGFRGEAESQPRKRVRVCSR